MQPGQTIEPNKGSDVPSPAPDDVDTPLPEPQEPETPQTPREPHEPDAPETNWNYQAAPSQINNLDPSPQQPVSPVNSLVTWSASEFVDHEKRAGWFLILTVGAVLAAVLLYFLTDGDIVTVVIVLVAALLLGIVAARKPRTLTYELSNAGIRIDKKHYPYNDFKFFSVIEEGAINSVQLFPLKRFMPTLTLYYPPDHEDQILNTLADYLPHEERSQDAIDRLMHRIRF